MDTTLRPLSLGEVLDRTFQLYRKHFLMFAGISSFAAGLDLLWKLVQTTTVRAIQNRIGATALGGISAGFSLVNALIYLIVSAVAMAAITRAVSAIYLGQPTGIAQAYREVRSHWFRYVWLYIVAAILAWGPVMLLFIAIIVVAIALPGTTSTLGSLVLPALFGLAMLVLVPFGIWMSLRYSLANPACVFEDLRVLASLKRSVHLSKGAMQKLSIFVMLFLVWLISAILAYAGLTPLFFLLFRAFSSNQGVPSISLAMTVYTLMVGFIVTSVTVPLYSIGLTLFYYDARIRKEGFDVEFLLQRAASEPIPPGPLAPESLPAESPGQA